MAASHVFKFLRRSDGSRDLAVDGSAVPQVFTVGHPPVVRISRVLFRLADRQPISLDKFGSLPPLTNGLKVRVMSADGVETDFFDGETIKTLSDFSLLAGVDSLAADGTNWHCRWTISKAGEWLKLTTGQWLELTVSDDLSDLGNFYAMVQGV